MGSIILKEYFFIKVFPPKFANSIVFAMVNKLYKTWNIFTKMAQPSRLDVLDFSLNNLMVTLQ